MEEFLKENMIWIIIVGALILTFIFSCILSFIVRKKQTKKDSMNQMEYNKDFQKFSVKKYNVDEVVKKTKESKK